MSEIKELCQFVNQCVDQCLAQGQDPSDLLMPPFSMNISCPTGSGKTYYIKEIMKLPQFKNAQIHLFSMVMISRGVMIHNATIRYVSRYKPQDTVYDTIHKTRYTTKAEAPQQSSGPIK